MNDMDHLVTSYKSLEQHWKVMNLQEQILERQKRVLGEEDPQTILAMGNLIVTLRVLQLKERMVDLLLIAVPLCARVQGTSHPDFVALSSVLYESLGSTSI